MTINGVDYTVEVDAASACVDLLDCNTISWTSGSYDSETSWTLGDVAAGSGGSGAGTYGDCGVTGCTDASACNYNADAEQQMMVHVNMLQKALDVSACNCIQNISNC